MLPGTGTLLPGTTYHAPIAGWYNTPCDSLRQSGCYDDGVGAQKQGDIIMHVIIYNEIIYPVYRFQVPWVTPFGRRILLYR